MGICKWTRLVLGAGRLEQMVQQASAGACASGLPSSSSAGRGGIRSVRTGGYRLNLPIVFFYPVIIGITVVMLLPFAWMLSASLKLSRDVFVFPIEWIPSEPRWQNYIDIWTKIPLAVFIYNFARRPSPEDVKLAWTASLVLVAVVLAINLCRFTYGHICKGFIIGAAALLSNEVLCIGDCVLPLLQLVLAAQQSTHCLKPVLLAGSDLFQLPIIFFCLRIIL